VGIGRDKTFDLFEAFFDVGLLGAIAVRYSWYQQKCLSHRPMLRQRLSLFQHRQRRLLLLVRWVAALAQDALDQHAELGADVLSLGQSIVTLDLTVVTSSRAMSRRVSSPSTFTALSLVSRAS
jgi:hypothetical protein